MGGKRVSLEDRIRKALAKKPSALKISPQQLIVSNNKIIGGKTPPSRVIMPNRKRKQPHTIPNIEPVKIAKKILVTGGVGDFFAIESMMSNDQKEALEAVYYATRSQKIIQSLLENHPSFPNLKTHEIVYDDWSSRFCFINILEVRASISNPKILDNVDDWSISRIFSLFHSKYLKYEICSFLSHTFAKVDRFNLPPTYITIAPYSINDKRNPRDFNEQDWKSLTDALIKNNLIGVVLNIGEDPVPNHPNIINLSNQTSIQESIEILRGSIGFVGIDSCLSVIASKMFNENNIFIKSANQWINQHLSAYYSPRSNLQITHDKINNKCLDDWVIPTLARPKSLACKGGEITINVVQGIGDIFWVYQKFSPYFNKINFNVLAIFDNVIQKRAEEFLTLLPKTGELNYNLVSSAEYDAVAKTRYYAKNYLTSDKTIIFACNRLLEEGKNLFDIDIDLSVETDVKIKEECFDLPYEEYCILYVSGNKPPYAWGEKQWCNLITSLNLTQNLPIVLIGAEYDSPVLERIYNHLQEIKVNSTLLINMPFANIVYLIKNSKFFIGYQSGLNILADNFDIPQIMLYFPELHLMLNTWAKTKNINSKKFNAFTFDQTIEEISEQINNHLII